MEEHNKYGGLGGAVSEVLAENSAAVPFAKIALNDTYVHKVGSQGGDAVFIQADVSRNEEVNAAVNNIISRFGKADKNPDTPSGVYVFS